MFFVFHNPLYIYQLDSLATVEAKLESADDFDDIKPTVEASDEIDIHGEKITSNTPQSNFEANSGDDATISNNKTNTEETKESTEKSIKMETMESSQEPEKCANMVSEAEDVSDGNAVPDKMPKNCKIEESDELNKKFTDEDTKQQNIADKDVGQQNAADNSMTPGVKNSQFITKNNEMELEGTSFKRNLPEWRT